MATKITSLTKEQEAKIPDYIAKWVKVASQQIDRKAATKAVQDIYVRMGEEKPIVVFGESPLATAFMAAITFTIVKPENKKELQGQLRDELWDQLGRQLRDELWDELRDQLRDQLGGQLGGELGDELGDELRDQLGRQLRGELRDELQGQLRDQLGGQLGGQLRGELRGELQGQLGGELRDELQGQLRGELWDELQGQLRDQLGDQLGGQLGGELGDELGDELQGQLGGELGGQLRDQLKTIQSSYSFYEWWLAYSGWFDYGQFIGVEFDKKLYDLFMAFVSNVGFIIPYKGIAFVSERPTRVVWDQNRRLSYDHGKAVEYKDGWGVYALDGVRFTEDEWTKITNQEFTLETIGQANMGTDKSAVAQKYLRPDRLLEACKAKLIHTGIKGTRLYQVDNFMGTRKTQYCMRMKHPSIDREFIEWIHPDIGKQKDADLAQAAAWVDKDGNHIPVEDYLNAIEA